MKKLFSHIHDHVTKHPHKYIGIAAFCKVMLVWLLAVPVIQLIQNTYAIEIPAIIDIGVNCGGGKINSSIRLEYNTWVNSIKPETYFTIGWFMYPPNSPDGSNTVYINIFGLAEGDYILDIAADMSINDILDSSSHAIPFTVDCVPNVVGGGGSSVTKDSCCLTDNINNQLPGANRLCTDYLPKVKNNCGWTQEEADCLNDLNTCLGLTPKTKLLSDLNYIFDTILWSYSTQKKTEIIETEDNAFNLIPTLTDFARQLSALNQRFTEYLLRRPPGREAYPQDIWK